MRAAAMFLAGLCVVATAAPAQNSLSQEPLRITITKTDCSRLVRHTPRDDVTYRPGEAANGRRVVPADVEGSGAQAMGNILPDVLELPITVSPLAWGSQAAKAKAAKAITDNSTAIAATQSAQTSLTADKSTADTKYNAYMTQYSAAKDRVVAATGGTAPSVTQSEIRTQQLTELENTWLSTSTYKKLLKDKTAAADAVTANTAKLTALQNATSGLNTAYTQADVNADKAEAAAAAKGLGNSTLNVGLVRYDIARNSFTFNGEPIGTAEQQQLAETCAKRGVK